MAPFQYSLPSSDHYRPDIDGLRAFAVLSVVLYHAFPGAVRGGYVGVDIFFVISGFLISSILFKELGENRFTFSAFYGRRVRRIFPALAVCLIAVLAYGFIALMPFELAQLGKHVFFGASFLSNIALWNESGYFDTAASLKPLLHLWSLGVEEQFYIFWPILLWMAFRINTPVGLLLSAAFLASFVANILLSTISPSADFYLPVSRFWELLAGAGLAWLPNLRLTQYIRSWISVAGAVALLASVTLFTTGMNFPGWAALLPVAGAAALISAGPDAIVNRIVLSNRVAVFVGLISYPLYIWHWPLISYALVVRMEKPLPPLMAGALVATSILLAWITYRFIEQPIRFGSHRYRRTVVTCICIAALGVIGLAIWMNRGFPERFPPYPDGLDIRKISTAKLDPIYQPTRGMKVEDHDTILISHLGQGDRKVALAGDSMLQHYGPRVQQLADEGRLAANTYFVTLPSCAPVPGLIDSSRCFVLPGLLTDLVRRENVQSVVLGALWMGYSGEKLLVEREGKRFPLHTAEGVNAFYANLEDYVRVLQSAGATVYRILGVPGPDAGFNPSLMITRSLTGFRIAPDFDKALSVKALRAPHAAVDAKLRVIAEHTGAILLDSFTDICGTGENCAPIFGASEPKFSDGMHLRPIFVQKHLHFLDPLLK